MTVSAGETIQGRYTPREHLDTGGFGSVWRAHDEKLDRDVALKIPTYETNDRATVQDHFRREQELLEPFARGLSHGTVVRYLDGDLDSDQPYIALEYLSGDPLVEKFGTGALGSGVRRRIGTDLAETLDFLHRNDVVYLDLKPENVIVRRSGRPVLLDFNTAIRPEENPAIAFEADQFKAPELLAGSGTDGPIGPWTDVYSWGKLAFYLLTGAKVPTEKVPEYGLDPTQFGGECEQDYAAVIRRATMPDTDDRYRDGVELAAAVADATHRGERAVLSHPATGVSCAVGIGDTIGRLDADNVVPWVVLRDPDRHVSPRHARIDRTDGNWVIRDTSINGTYVASEGTTTYILSEEGYRKQTASGRLETEDPQPPTVTDLAEDARIAPVHPEYGIVLQASVPARQ